MATAVLRWSPVIMTVRMPDVRHLAMASRTSGRGGSIMATRPAKARSRSMASAAYEWGSCSRVR